MVFYTESSLGSSLHNNGHAEYKIKEQLGINGVSLEPMDNPIHWRYSVKVLSLQECQQSCSPNLQEGVSLGTQTQKRDVTNLIFLG